MPTITGPVVVTADQAANLNSVFLEWLDLTKPGTDPVQRLRAMREANWQATRVEDYENHLARLTDWVAAAKAR